mmetsp:Transcript_105806/g.242266  ORF Transcript_105806/g.242266 Transcript_105806/m.242266 type:complete len:201 (-) Transcript_105806:448-1050(-)
MRTSSTTCWVNNMTAATDGGCSSKNLGKSRLRTAMASKTSPQQIALRTFCLDSAVASKRAATELVAGPSALAQSSLLLAAPSFPVPDAIPPSSGPAPLLPLGGALASNFFNVLANPACTKYCRTIARAAPRGISCWEILARSSASSLSIKASKSKAKGDAPKLNMIFSPAACNPTVGNCSIAGLTSVAFPKLEPFLVKKM